MEDLKNKILNSIPDQMELRRRLAENMQERIFIRKMLRLAVQKDKVEEFAPKGNGK